MKGIRDLNTDYLRSDLYFYLFTPEGIEKLLRKDEDKRIYKHIQSAIPDDEKIDYWESRITKDIEDFNH